MTFIVSGGAVSKETMNYSKSAAPEAVEEKTESET
jgi:hypothetical protein